MQLVYGLPVFQWSVQCPQSSHVYSVLTCSHSWRKHDANSRSGNSRVLGQMPVECLMLYCDHTSHYWQCHARLVRTSTRVAQWRSLAVLAQRSRYQTYCYGPVQLSLCNDPTPGTLSTSTQDGCAILCEELGYLSNLNENLLTVLFKQ